MLMRKLSKIVCKHLNLREINSSEYCPSQGIGRETDVVDSISLIDDASQLKYGLRNGGSNAV